MILIAMTGYTFAAAPVVDNVEATPSAGQVSVTYDLAADTNCAVTLLISADNGVSFSDIPPTAVSGAIGKGVSAGFGKQIIWHPAGDGMEVGANYKAKIIARENPSPNAADDFILVEGDSFHNGTSEVTLSSFYIDKYEVTQADYQAVMGFWDSDPVEWDETFGLGSSYPIYYVSWFNAIEYCNRRSLQEGLNPCYSYSTYGTNPNTWPAGWDANSDNHTNVSCNWTADGYRLPTEMEWMYAAQGGNQSEGYTYSGSNTIDDVAWHAPNASSTTVGTMASNELGIYDMSGNVWEYVWDINGDYPSGPQTNPTGATNGTQRVIRGGGFDSNASSCSVAHRSISNPTDRFNNSGFRLCRTSP